MGDRTCSMPGCEHTAHARGMCNTHYRRFLKRGTAEDLWSPARDERAARVGELYKSGSTIEEIAEATGVCNGTINNMVRKAGIPRRRAPKPAPKLGGRESLCEDQLSIFFLPNDNKDGAATARARSCRQRRVQDNERIRATEKARLARPEVRVRVAEQQARYRISPSGRYRQFVSKVKRKKVVNELTLEQWLKITANPCVYCGSHCLENTKNGYGVDRVDCMEGYTLENSVACCATCNIMKYRRSAQDFLAHARRIVAYQDSRQAA